LCFSEASSSINLKETVVFVATKTADLSGSSAVFPDKSKSFSQTMEGIVKRLASLRPTIEEMVSLSGTAGLTYGVIYRGHIIHTENFGYRDVENKLPVNEDTIFQVASLTKSMIAATIGMLVEDKKMNWNTPIKEILPGLHVEDPIVRNSTTIVDCLAHRTGLQMNNYWLESNNNIIIPIKDSMKLLNGLRPVKPFRG
jgi:CubicO group peptidase (beta-lactamase class C family)